MFKTTFRNQAKQKKTIQVLGLALGAFLVYKNWDKIKKKLHLGAVKPLANQGLSGAVAVV